MRINEHLIFIKYSNLYQFNNVLQVYEKEVRARDATKGVQRDVDAMFGALRDDGSPMDTSTADSTPRLLPFKPLMSKKPSLTKTPSITSLKKKSSLLSAPVKRISKPRKRLTAEEKRRQKVLFKSKVNIATEIVNRNRGRNDTNFIEFTCI